ncbi:Transglutaminase-like superfamily protein [Gimesia panareensis]|uniref:Transglutaminase-like superfamily protein n=1 Tax=Gimesia panareensis TaxID=2527978 RepID=A0A518FX05_9PLAN|nr:transglutaminase domain-containing protein [Gimesia panareensis]QDV20918.1 Transglutaminase-like superfamily protein [Gimesia panareensis]
MNHSRAATTVKPGRKLWRTRFKLPRKVLPFSPRISINEVRPTESIDAELQHWGEVILLSDLVAVLHRDGTITRRAHHISSLYANEALAQWDEVFRFYDRQTALHKIQTAKVYLPDGSQRKARKVIQPYGQIAIQYYPLRPGVTVELEEQHDFFTPDRITACMWGQEYLRYSLPCQRLRCTVAVSAPFRLQYQLHLTEQEPRTWKQGSYQIYQWDLHQLPGYETDDGTPHPRDVLPWVDFTTLSDWEPIKQYYRQDLEPPASIPTQIQKLSDDLTRESESTEQKIYTLYKYASEDVRYGRHPSELNLEKTREVGSMLEDMRGDCKDKSALLVSLLRHQGIEAEIAVLLTRINGTVSFLPGARFDHAIVCVTFENGERLWLDPAAGPMTFKDIPYNDQGMQALLLKSAAGELTRIPSGGAESNHINRKCQGTLSADCSYRFTTNVSTTGDTAMEFRLRYVDRNEAYQSLTLEKELASSLTGAQIEAPQFLNLTDLSQPVSYSCQMTLDQWSRKIEDIILFRVPWIGAMHTVALVNVQKRNSALQAPWPVRFTDYHKIELPAGFQGYGLPYAQQYECDWGRYHVSISEEDSQLICCREVDHLGGIIREDQYLEFKKYWEQCTRADALDVVLMKTHK